MATITAKMIGDKALRRELMRLSKRAPRAVAHALFDEAAVIFSDSQDEVPVDFGDLRRSGRVRAREGLIDVTVWVSYGTNYALRIHEDQSLDAKRRARAELALSNPGYKPRGATTGKSKYLQDPFEHNVPGIAGRIAARARMAVESRAGDPGPVSARKIDGKNKKGGD